METKCQICGASLENGKCNYCGYVSEISAQNTASINNPSCQTQTVQEQQYTINTPTFNNTGITPGVSRKSKTTALLLCIFAGYVGAHKFYVGKIGTGIIYLFTAGLFGFGWIIDIILIAAGSFRDEFGLPLLQ